MIDPKSIKPIKYKNEDAVLKMFLKGSSIRNAAYICNVSSKTAHNIRKKHAHLFPEKEKVVKEVKQPKIPGVKRWLTVPKELDRKIENAAVFGSIPWKLQAIKIFEAYFNNN